MQQGPSCATSTSSAQFNLHLLPYVLPSLPHHGAHAARPFVRNLNFVSTIQLARVAVRLAIAPAHWSIYHGAHAARPLVRNLNFVSTIQLARVVVRLAIAPAHWSIYHGAHA